jgi:NAD(P)-dependent dehydrogenase (short-subunit alcohol dehydrogenase family)
MEIEGRIAVVTGAAGGIGSALVRALADAGARAVVSADLTADRVEALTAELTGESGQTAGGTRILPRALDVADGPATAALVEAIESSLGPVDLWFANAGITGGGGPEANDAACDRQWQVNVMAHVHAARALLPGWRARGEGHLVTTASMAGILTSLGDGVYAATKHAAVGFAEWLAITYGGEGVKVSCVCPGAVDTPMLRGSLGDADQASANIGAGDVLPASEAAARILAGVREDRFLIYTHPEMQTFVERKAADTDRWIAGMQRLWARTQHGLGG